MTTTNTKAKKVSAHDFCVAWMTSETVAEVVAKTGLKPGTVSQRASSLRGKGVELKFFAKKSPRINYADLASLVAGMESSADTEDRKARAKKKKLKKTPAVSASTEDLDTEDLDTEDLDTEDFTDEDLDTEDFTDEDFADE